MPDDRERKKDCTAFTTKLISIVCRSSCSQVKGRTRTQTDTNLCKDGDFVRRVAIEEVVRIPQGLATLRELTRLVLIIRWSKVRILAGPPANPLKLQ